MMNGQQEQEESTARSHKEEKKRNHANECRYQASKRAGTCACECSVIISN